MSQEPRIQHGQCHNCFRKKTIVDAEFPVKFTITYPKPGHSHKHEACCTVEYWKIKKVFMPFSLVELGPDSEHLE